VSENFLDNIESHFLKKYVEMAQTNLI